MRPGPARPWTWTWYWTRWTAWVGSWIPRELDPLLAQYAPPSALEELREVRGMLRREVLEERLQLELGDLRPGTWVERPFGRTLVQPLGVLLHITPGNQMGIPLFSALEGLLTGNLNLIKLPHGDRGLTLAALELLTQREPRLAPWLCAFAVSSRDADTLERLARPGGRGGHLGRRRGGVRPAEAGSPGL